MKTVLLAMTEEQHDKRSWRATSLIGMFLALSLSLSFCVREQSMLTKNAIITYNNNHNAAGEADQKDATIDPDRAMFLFTAAVAVLQVIVTAVVLTAEAPSVRGDLPDKEALVIVVIAHAGFTFLRDFLVELGVATGDPITVQGVAYFSPILALAAIWLVTSLPARPVTWVSLFMIGFGCSMITGNSGVVPASGASVAASNRAALVCGLVFLAVAMRNIVLRQMVHMEGVEIKSRPLPVPYNRVETWVAMAGLGTFAVVSVFLLAPEGWGPAAFCAALTCVMSSALFLVTIHVIKAYGVISTALFAVWALLLESLITTPLPFRPGLVSCFIALLLLAAGHWLYLRNLAEPEAGLITSASGTVGDWKPVSIHEQYTRLEFLLFAAAVVGVIFYVFQPRVSQRDLDTLSYVGLDKVIRRLLSVSGSTESLS